MTALSLVGPDHEGGPRMATNAGRQMPDAVDVEGLAADGSTLDAGAWRRPDERRPVVAPWLRDRPQRRAAARWWCGHAGHVVAFHGLRAPLYWGRAARRSPIGLWRVLCAVVRWVADARTAAERAALTEAVRADSRGAPQLDHAAERHRQAVRVRLAALAVIVAALGAGVVAMADRWGPAPLVALWALTVAALGIAGRPLDRPLTTWAVSTDDTPRLTPDLIVAALDVCGVAKLTQALKVDPRAVRFVSPVARAGDGFRVDVDLPPGVTAAMVVERRSALASALRRTLSQVWPGPDPDAHEGRLTLFVGDKPMSAQRAAPWPLAARGAVNLFDPFPVGVDERGSTVTLTLMYASAVIGAVPRAGKTFALRLWALAAALDPRAELHIFDLKGGGDFGPLAPVAHVYRAGDDPDDLAAAVADMRALVEDMRRRYRTVRELPPDVCPESKVTDALASRRSLGLWPVVIVVDECQIWWESDHGKELENLVTDLVKRGPAVGIIAICATQRPDAKSLPVGIRDNAVVRACLRVASDTANNMVLGPGAYGAGYQATAFTSRDKGVAWLVGDDPDPRICRFSFVDAVAAGAVVERARAVRAAAGLLSGHAAGQATAAPADEDTASVIDHVAAVWPEGGPSALWLDELAALLSERRPLVYGALDARALGSALRAQGVEPRNLRRGDAVRKGVTLDDIGAALADRSADAEAPDVEGVA